MYCRKMQTLDLCRKAVLHCATYPLLTGTFFEVAPTHLSELLNRLLMKVWADAYWKLMNKEAL
jgi:hypothetical protein